MNAQTALAQLALLLAEVSQQRDQAVAATQELARRVQALEAATQPAETAGVSDVGVTEDGGG